MIVRILPAVEVDLEAIGDDIARDNLRRAVSFVRKLRERRQGLADMALVFPFVPRYEGRGLWHWGQGNDQIFYRVVGQPVDRIDVASKRCCEDQFSGSRWRKGNHQLLQSCPGYHRKNVASDLLQRGWRFKAGSGIS